jgi:hypothetical protein
LKEGVLKQNRIEQIFVYVGAGIFLLIFLYYWGAYIIAFLAVCGLLALMEQYHKGKRRDRDDR